MRLYDSGRTFPGRGLNFGTAMWRSLALGALGLAAIPAGPAIAYTQAVLYAFCQQNNCTDGQTPQYLARHSSGSLFGTTYYGGEHGHGTIFALTPGSGGSWAYNRLHSFCAAANCTDGDRPGMGLISDIDGSLYGVTTSGGATGFGGIFRLLHKPSGWTFRMLYSFCPGGVAGNCPDGSYPYFAPTYVGQTSGAPWDKTSPLFGTARNGGKYNYGVVYRFVPNGTGFQESVVYSFHTAYNSQGLVADGSGNLFGIASAGGKYNGGTLFKLDHGTWTETTLHNFCHATGCADGNKPVGVPTLDGAGNVFGVAQEGGANCPTSDGDCGNVFEYKADGTFAVLHNFCAWASCADGAVPFAGVALDNAGNLFGTTGHGTANDHGVAFRLRHGTWGETVLYSFCQQTSCHDGSYPTAPLVLDGNGDLFSTTGNGGQPSGSGTVFELTP